MEETYQIEYRDDHLFVKLRPNYVPAVSQDEIWERVRNACEKNKTCRVLVEGKIPESDRPPIAIVQAGKKAATIPNLWLAFHFDEINVRAQSEGDDEKDQQRTSTAHTFRYLVRTLNFEL